MKKPPSIWSKLAEKTGASKADLEGMAYPKPAPDAVPRGRPGGAVRAPRPKSLDDQLDEFVFGKKR